MSTASARFLLPARHFRFPLRALMPRLHLLAAVLGCCSLPLAQAAPSPLALSCLGCHQPAVNSAEMPALLRLPPAAIEASLKAARDQPQSGAIMARFAAKLSDAEIAALAAELGQPGAVPR